MGERRRNRRAAARRCAHRKRLKGRVRSKEKGRAAGRLTLGWRCNHRRLDEEGGAAQVFTAAPRLLLCPGSPPTWAAPPGRERPPVLAHRWRHGRWLPLLRSSPSFPHSLFPSPLTAANPRWGKPQCALVTRGTRRRGNVGARSKRRVGAKSLGAPGLGARASLATWPAPNGRHCACRVTGRGNRGISP
jgi:hypothetical protein